MDGGIQRDPYAALKISRDSLRMFDSVTFPEGLPARTRDQLTRFRDLLRQDTSSFVADAESEIARVEKRTKPIEIGGISIYAGSPTSHPTCTAYGIISSIYRQYKLDSMMKGSYINCEEISKALH